MTKMSFTEACQRLSIMIDGKGHEEKRWAANEGAALRNAADMAVQLFKSEGEFRLLGPAEIEGGKETLVYRLNHAGTNDDAGLVYFKATGTHLMIWAKINSAGGFSLANFDQASVEIDRVDQPWLEATFAEMVGKVSFAGQ